MSDLTQYREYPPVDTGRHRHRYSPRFAECVVFFPGVGRTKSEFRESCDVNYILKKYQKTGIVPIMKGTPQYGDFSDTYTYQEAQNLILEANDNFNSLPSDLRKRFHNDPALFLEFCSNPKNEQELIDLGVFEKPSPSIPPNSSSDEGGQSEPASDSSSDSASSTESVQSE